MTKDFYSEQVSTAAKQVSFIPKVLVSNLSQRIGSPGFFCEFPRSVMTIARKLSSKRSQQ